MSAIICMHDTLTRLFVEDEGTEISVTLSEAPGDQFDVSCSVYDQEARSYKLYETTTFSSIVFALLFAQEKWEELRKEHLSGR